jgi:glycine cleavage system H protein
VKENTQTGGVSIMKIPEELKYTKSHEWLKVEGNKGYVGITDFAQHHLGDLVFVELPEMDAQVAAGEVLCAIESVKAASDVYSPASGKVVEVNEALEDDAGLINEDPYANWIAVLELSDPSEADSLMDAEAYREHCEKEEEAMG